MITPSFSPTATERVLPKLALDFTTATLDSRITFTRALNTATRINSSGYIELVNADTPRFDYSNTTIGVCKGLLIEETRTNLFLQSQFASGWTTSNASLTGSTTSPDGTVNAPLLSDTSASTSGYVYQDVAVTAATVYVYSLYVKPQNRITIQLQTITEAGVCVFTLTDAGSAGVPSGIFTEPTITKDSNGWYRCTVKVTPTITQTVRFAVASGASAYTGGLSYIWGAQLEAGAFATSYIPTTTTALTRNADVATMTGTNFSSWWVATNGSSDIWLIPKSTSTLAYMSFDDNTANNKIIVANSTTSGQSTITSAGVLQATLTAGTITANATNKVGCSWNTNNCAATANATAPATTASATIPTVTQLRIGSNGSLYANAWIQKLFYWPQRITNNEIQAFTK